MLVSHRHKFIYTKSFKTGGTSVEAYFERFCVKEDEGIPNLKHYEIVSDVGIVGGRGGFKYKRNMKWKAHMPAKKIKAQIGEKIWQSYFKFCTIRNPYQLPVSRFYFDRGQNPNKLKELLTLPLPEVQNLFERWLLRREKRIGMEDFAYIIDGQFCLDDFIRYESLTEDLERICHKLNLPWNPAWLPKFYSGMRPQYATAKKLHTPKTKEWVEEKFAFELDYFGYSFPSE